MTPWDWLLVSAGVMICSYAAFLTGLVISGRRDAARAVARFVPDCIVLFRRLFGDARISRRKKLLLALPIAYLATPVDLVPDFIPVAGYLDDAVVVAFVLRHILRDERGLIEEHWPGPPQTRDFILRLAGAGP
jgi:uncharacterized membrane protein YkvA (DUF1232 family)